MIYIPKHKEVIVPSGTVSYGIEGEFRFVLMDINGSVIQDTGFNKNLITDFGMNQIGIDSGFKQYISVGSGNTPASVSDTQLQSGFAVEDASAVSGYPTDPVAPNYECSGMEVARFDVGEAVGTIREVGAGTTFSTAGTNLFARHVLPVPVNKTSEQVLDVYYKFTVWPNLTDITGTANIVIDGVSNTYNTTSRWAYIGGTDRNANYFGWHTGAGGSWRVYDGELGDINSQPLGNAGSSDPLNRGSYVASGAGFRVDEKEYTLNYSIIATPIRSMTARTFNTEYCQCRFGLVGTDDPLPAKDNTMVMFHQWRMEWERKV